MAMNTYTLLNDALIEWLNRSGFSELTTRSEDLIAMGQRRIHRTCDLNTMETVLAQFTQSTETKAVPSDYLRTKTFTYVIGDNNVEMNGAPLKKVKQAGRSGMPKYYATVGDNFHFGPIPNQDYEMDLVYYAALDILSTTVSTNWISENIPELLLYAALVEAAIWLKDDARLAVFGGRYEEIKTELLASEERMDKEAGSLQVREMTDRNFDGNGVYY